MQGKVPRQMLTAEMRGGGVLPMKSVGIEALHNRLVEYVQMAASGETILVTDHNRVVAEIRPPGLTGGSALTGTAPAESTDNGRRMPQVFPAGGSRHLRSPSRHSANC